VASVREGRTGETSVAEAHVASHWVARRKAVPFPNHLIEITWWLLLRVRKPRTHWIWVAAGQPSRQQHYKRGRHRVTKTGWGPGAFANHAMRKTFHPSCW